MKIPAALVAQKMANAIWIVLSSFAGSASYSEMLPTMALVTSVMTAIPVACPTVRMVDRIELAIPYLAGGTQLMMILVFGGENIATPVPVTASAATMPAMMMQMILSFQRLEILKLDLFFKHII